MPPLEEADAFATLRDVHGRSVDEIAARIGRSPAYIARRLQLTLLTKTNRKLLEEGAILFGVAEVLARIPNKAVQDEAGKALSPGWQGQVHTVAHAKQLVRERYMLRLHEAPFSIGDAELDPKAGACSACPKRTAAQALLFPEAEADDLCLDPVCWKVKKETSAKVRLDAARKAGEEVLPDAEAKKLFPYQHSIPDPARAGWIDLGSETYDPKTGRARKWNKVLGKDRTPPVVLARDPHTGDVRELVRLADVKKLAKESPKDNDPVLLGGRAGSTSKTSSGPSAAEKREKLKREVRRKAAPTIVAQLVAKLEDDKAVAKIGEALLWRTIAAGALDVVWSETVKEVAERRGLVGEATVALERLIEGASVATCRALTVELMIGRSLPHRGGVGRAGYAERVLGALGIDWVAVEKEVVDARDAKSAAKGKGAKGKKAARSTKASASKAPAPKSTKTKAPKARAAKKKTSRGAE